MGSSRDLSQQDFKLTYMRKNYAFCLVGVCFTILMFVWLVRGSLCELHIKQGNTELSAYLAYEVEQR
ncbi:TPA: Hok/Gef family protein [Salmonella enterica subsp. enterica serovar Muenchen]